MYFAQAVLVLAVVVALAIPLLGIRLAARQFA
jgi:hypothetical protein